MINDLPNRYERIALAQKAAFLILMIFAFTCALEHSLETEYCRASLESFKESFRTGRRSRSHHKNDLYISAMATIA